MGCYISGECDSLKALLSPESCKSGDPILKSLCCLNPHLDQRSLLRQGTLPPFTPILHPSMVGSNRVEQQHQMNKIKAAPLEKRQQFHYIQQNAEALDAVNQIIEDLNEYNRDFMARWENPLSPQPIAVSLSVADTLMKQGRQKIQTGRSYNTSKSFLEALSTKDFLGERYNYLKKLHGKGHPTTRSAYQDYIKQRDTIKTGFANEVARLSKYDRKKIQSPSLGYKIAPKGTNQTLEISSKIGKQMEVPLLGSRVVSYETMERISRGARYFSNGLLMLGTIGASLDSYVALHKGEDSIRPLAKFGAGLAGGWVGGELGLATAGAIATISGESAYATVLVLTCTPWGWVALAVVTGATAYVGSQYGEEIGLKLYDQTKRIGKEAYDQGGKLLGAAEKKIAEFWGVICNHAAELHSHFIHENPFLKTPKVSIKMNDTSR